MTTQGDAIRRAERELAKAKNAGAERKDIAKLEAAVNAAKAEERKAKKGSGGGISRALGF